MVLPCSSNRKLSSISSIQELLLGTWLGGLYLLISMNFNVALLGLLLMCFGIVQSIHIMQNGCQVATWNHTLVLRSSAFSVRSCESIVPFCITIVDTERASAEKVNRFTRSGVNWPIGKCRAQD